MTDDVSASAPPATPTRGVSWLKIVLVLSLSLNLLFIGAAAARFFVHHPPERITGISQMQLVPRRFFGELDRSRRLELLGVFKEFRGEFREGRKAARQQMVNLATVLEREPYDEAAVRAVVDAFSKTSSDLIGQGGHAALTFIGKLTPEERRLLAKHIRLRDEGGRPRDSKDGSAD